MKAVIVELRGTQAAALDENGVVRIIPDRNYAVGQTVLLGHRNRLNRTFLTRAAAVAAAAVLACGITSYALPVSAVSLDAGSSFSYTLNVYNRVIGIRAVAADASATAAAVRNRIFGKTAEEAVSITLDALNRTDGTVIIAVSGRASRSDRLAQELQDSGAIAAELPADAAVTSITAAKELTDEAKAKDTTPGKLYLINRLRDAQAGAVPFDENSWLQKSAAEIESAILDAEKPAAETAPSGTSAGDGSRETPVSSPDRKAPAETAAAAAGSASSGTEDRQDSTAAHARQPEETLPQDTENAGTAALPAAKENADAPAAEPPENKAADSPAGSTAVPSADSAGTISAAAPDAASAPSGNEQASQASVTEDTAPGAAGAADTAADKNGSGNRSQSPEPAQPQNKT